MKAFAKRYRMLLILLAALAVLFIVNQTLALNVVNNTASNIKQMLLLLPPVFIILGLLDVWIPRETMMRAMGENSGVKGIVLAFVFGSFTSGPLYAAFPVAAVFMKKGVKFSNVLIFIGAWSTTKIPLLLFEFGNLGWRFALTRLIIDIPGIIIMSQLVASLVSKKEIDEIYAKAEKSE